MIGQMRDKTDGVGGFKNRVLTGTFGLKSEESDGGAEKSPATRFTMYSRIQY